MDSDPKKLHMIGIDANLNQKLRMLRKKSGKNVDIKMKILSPGFPMLEKDIFLFLFYPLH